MARVSRRRFLAAATILPAHIALKRCWASFVSEPRAVCDVAIIGGGVAGAYVAWKLLNDPRRRFQKVKLFEASGRIGGRLLSVHPPNDCEFVAELGGMRILPNIHTLTFNLIKDLKLEHDLYEMPVSQKGASFAFLKGTSLLESDFMQKSNSKLKSYHLKPEEEGYSPNDLVVNAIDSICPGIKEDRAAVRRERVKDEKLKLYAQGFRDVLRQKLSLGAYQLCVDALGYESIFDNWNAADAIPWYLSDFGEKAPYKGFKNGFQQVPKLMVKEIEKEGEIRFNAVLRGFDYKDGLFELDFGNGNRVHANRLVLAMPRRSLELLSTNSRPLRNQEVMNLISSVTGRPLLKFFATYDFPWWNTPEHPLIKGRTTTDLPLRQVYYWARNGTYRRRGDAMLMASYDDGINVKYWEGFRCQGGKESGSSVKKGRGDGCELFKGKDGQLSSAEWLRHLPERRMVEEIQRLLGQVHELQSSPPEPLAAAYMDWADDPFGGGWNSWNIGVKSWDVRDRIVEPVKGMPLYICGEAYSDWQGWVEGALQTAKMVLDRIV